LLGKSHTLKIADCLLKDTDSSIEIRLKNQNKKSKAQLKVEHITMDQFIKVSMPLKDVSVKSGEDAVFECVVAVSPVLSQLNMDVLVKWHKDGQNLPEIEKYEYLDETDDQSNMKTQLKIIRPDQTDKDTGEYKVEFYLSEGSIQLAASTGKLSFNIEDCKGLKIKTPLLKIIRVKPTEKATLFTEYVEPIDKYRVEFYKDGQLLKFTARSVKYKLQVSGGKCTLFINEFVKEDTAKYDLKILSNGDKPDANPALPLSQQETSVELSEDGPAVVLEGLTDVNVEEGDTAKLFFKASKECMCEWYQFKDDPRKTLKNFTAKMVAAVRCEKVTADDRTVFSFKADNVYGLTFHDAQVTDSCWYVAMLTKDGVEAAGSDPLVFTCGRLNVKPQNIEILTKFPEKLTVPEKETLTLKCRVSKPLTTSIASRLHFFRNGEEIFFKNNNNNEQNTTRETIDPRFCLTDCGDGKVTISLSSCSFPDDTGLYVLKIDKHETKCQVSVEQAKKSILPPVITKDLDIDGKTANYSTKEPFSLSVTVVGDDLRSEWSRDGKKVVLTTDQSEIVKLDGDNNTYEVRLNFLTPFTSDSGKYVCKVTNPKGGVTSKPLTVKISDNTDLGELDESLFQSKPRFIEYFSDVYMEAVGVGEAQFKCKIIGKPEPKVSWSCNCSKITANEKYELIKDNEHYTLVVRSVGPKDEGEYTCKASNTKGEASWSANLYLNEISQKNELLSGLGEVAPNFVRKIKDSSVSENSRACFDCLVDGEPFPAVTWFNNNSPISPTDPRYLIQVDQTTARASLTILKSDKTLDEGEYSVKLTNKAGTSECSAFLVVESTADDATKSKRKVRFSSPKAGDVHLIPLDKNQVPKPPGQPVIEEYNTVNLRLKWPASPSDIEFSDDGTEVDSTVEAKSQVTYVIEYRTSKTYSWSVFAANIKGVSTYVDSLYPGLDYSFRIRAENSTGISDCSPVATTKNLKDNNKEKTSDEPLRSVRSDRISVGKKPFIAGEGKDVRYYIEGHTAEVAIEVNGFPCPLVKWIRNGQVLEKDQSTSIYTDNYNLHHLDILNASEKDEGLYTIVATNENGECSHDFYLQQADPPVFLEPFKDLTVENHHDVTMICKVDGIPYPEVKFYKDWHLLAESYRIRITHVEPDTWIITIKGAIVRDSGLYTCTAKNIAGGTLCSCNLNVADSLLNLPHPDLKTDLITFKRKIFQEDYDIVEELAKSVNSKIYRVIERRTARAYLAKVAGTAEYAEWIRTEADSLNQVHHITDECFVKMHDAYETPNKRFILIFEEIKGKGIIEYLLSDHTLLQEHKVALHLKKVLECLQHLHSRNIVHLDVNPDNIIVEDGGNNNKKIKLIGFTHSKSLKPDLYTNSPKETVFHDYGSPEYVAPEIVLNRPVTLNTDMWSIGVLAYQMLIGKSPFYASSMKETLENIVNNEWEALLGGGLCEMSHDAKDFIHSLFQNDPKDRLTVDQALAHPWISRACQQTVSCSVNQGSLMQLYSRHVWDNQTRQKQPWLKTQRISKLLDHVDQGSSAQSYGFEDAFVREEGSKASKKASKITRFSSFDDQVCYDEGSIETEELIPGTYLLPVRDPLFTVRIREYKRSRFEKLQQQQSQMTGN